MEIITCPQWGARKPKQDLTTIGRAHKIILHHTAGHHKELGTPSNESREESIRYARDIQNFHMDTNGWDDSGHNFLVCRNGLILQGRWLTVSTIQADHMVLSAHCPGQNNQVGIEHEHLGTEAPTEKQVNASAWLMAWIAHQYGDKNVLPVYPHSEYFNTACPANLKNYIPHLVGLAQQLLYKWPK